MTSVRLIGDQALNRIISKTRPVQWKLEEVAHEIGARARMNLAAHRDLGHARVEVERIKVKYGRIDWFVSLVDEAAWSIEWDHKHNISGEPVGGLHIIGRAARLM